MGLWGFVPVLVVLLITLSQVQGQGPDQAAMEAIRKGFSRPPTAWKDSKYCEWTDTSPNSKVLVRCNSGDSGKVTAIYVKDQLVGGYLDAAIGNLTSLQKLHIYNNGLTGDFPTLKGLSSLNEVLANDNNFSSFPPDLFSGLSGLTTFCINNNQFANWQIPESVKDMSSMAEFRARNVSITGNLPDYFNTTYMPSLTFLELSSNKLQGHLPASFAGSGIQTISLANNQLSGSLDVLNNMTGLQVVELNMNNFTGPLPDVSNLKNLSSIDVRDNNFITGVIPPSWLALMNSSSTNVTLGNNALQGPMPKADPVRVKVDGNNNFCTTEPGDKCDPRVDILLLIAKDMGYPFKLADSWKGNDPCSDSWKGTVTCSGGNITRINFGKLGSAGTISPHCSELTYLTDLRLNNNNLTGTIPVELTKLSSLKYLDLSYNQLYGIVPSFGPDVVVKLDGNPDIGKDHPSTGPGAPTGSNGGGNKTGMIVGTVVGCVFGLLVVGFLAFCLLRRKKRSFSKVQRPNSLVIHPRHSGDQNAVKITVADRFDGNVGVSNNGSTSYGPNDIHVEAGNMIISIQVLRSVTKNFNEDKILGKGGFGTVYEGEMHDGTKIAVKRMESGVVADKGLNEFKAEIAVLTKVRHRHLVGLLGYCLDGNERLLVYEHMPQGTLSRHLFNWKEEGLEPLDWTRRLSIALDVARGVEYLHGLANETFIHRDLKPSNILLGDDMRAKVSDFGLVRLAPAGKGSIETRLAGTFGYLAPEYAATGRMTVKVDVYSFGVILMELITGRRAIDESQPEESCHLVTWFRRNLIKKDALIEIIDPTIDVNEETLPSITTVAELAGHCSVREPYQRPEMGHAVNVLSSLVSHWKPYKDEETDDYAIDFDVPLNEVLKKWMNSEGKNSMDESSLSSVFPSEENSQTSIPPRPKGLLETLGESDAR